MLQAASAPNPSIAIRETAIRENGQITDALMIAFRVIVGDEHQNGCLQRVLSEQNYLFQSESGCAGLWG